MAPDFAIDNRAAFQLELNDHACYLNCGTECFKIVIFNNIV